MKRTLPSCLLIALSVIGFASQKPSAKEPDRKVYVVGTAHLDTQWRWTIQKTITDYIPDTLKMNLDYFDNYPDYIFSFEGTIRYQLAKEYYPDLYAKMKQRIKEGRWRVAGSWIDAVDVNMPSPEALIRQNLYGNGFFQKEFGKTSVDVFLPDCFGFGYALPSIAAHCGLTGFTTQKLLPYGSSYGGVPFNIGTWEGVDGSSIMAVLEPGRYRNDVGTDWYKADWLIKRIDDLGLKSGLFLDLRLHGTGDRGGGPTKRSMDNLANCIKEKGPIKVINKGSDDLFRELKPEQIKKLPTYNGELLMATHGVGCYTTMGDVKRLNRLNELVADSAERAATMAGLFGVKVPQQTLSDAWVRFLWHGFHDDLTGTSIPEVYDITKRDQLLSVAQFDDVLNRSIESVVAQCNTQVKGYPVPVFNPLAYSRRDEVFGVIEISKNDSSRYVRVFDPNGKEVPSRTRHIEPGHSAVFTFIPEFSGCGVTIYEARLSDEPYKNETLKVTERSLENARYLVTVSDAGDISSIMDKKNSRELLKSPIRLALLTDKPKRYASWEMNYEDVSAPPQHYVTSQSPADISIGNRGPVSVSLNIKRKCAGSTFDQSIILHEGSDRVEVLNGIDWQSRGMMLKAEFPVTTGNPKATYDLGLGTIERGNNKPNLYEVPAQQWADLTQPDGKFGVSILTSAKYGWDKPNDDTLRLTLVRNGQVKENDYQYNNDIGIHNFSYAIYGHEGDWRNGTVREAEKLSQRPVMVMSDKHAGKMPRQVNLVSCEDPRVSIKAIKKAENGNDWIVRVFESTGKPVVGAKIQFGSKVLSVREVNGFETPLAKPTLSMKSQAGEIVFDMKPYRPRTFAVKLAPLFVPTQKLVQKQIALPYDTDGVTSQGEKADSEAIPADLWPKQVDSGDAILTLALADRKNSVACQGQIIKVPENSKIVFLAHSIDGDRSGNLMVGSEPVTRRFYDWINKGATASEENWSGRSFAWVGTHRHDANGADMPYEFCYLHRHEIDVPKGVTTIKLPYDSRIRIYAMTALVRQ